MQNDTDLVCTMLQCRDEDIQVTDAEDKGDVFATYYADPSKSIDRPPTYSPELGLAIESLPDGASLSQIWNVV